jgi:amino acid transporter
VSTETNEVAPTSKPLRNLKLWGAIGLSLGIVGPSLAMAGNGQGTANAVGKAVPIIFVLGAIGIFLIAHGFIRLTQRFNQAGSAYALVGMTIGPRAGFFSGFGVMITYVFFAIGNLGACGSFVNAFIANAQSNPAHPFQVPWIITALVVLALAAFMSTREFRNVVRILLAIELIGVAFMTILVIVIFAKGGAAHGGGFNLSTFSPKGHSVTTIMGAVVAGFLSWAGFEGCAALGEETDNPRRNIPRALLGTVALTSVLFIVVMFAQTIGFGTNPAGLHAFIATGNSLATLGQTYVGLWFGLILSFTAVMSSFACHLGSSQTAGRLLWAFSRDGLGPKSWSKLDERNQPRNALYAVFGVILTVGVISYVTKHPVVGTGNAALDSYFYFATVGAICLMVSYLMVEIGTIVHLVRDRREIIGEIIFPILGSIMILAVFYFNVKGQTNWLAQPFLGGAVMLIALIVTLSFPGIANKVGVGLSRSLSEPEGKEIPASSGHGREPFPTEEV